MIWEYVLMGCLLIVQTMMEIMNREIANGQQEKNKTITREAGFD
jgi:hypothetical protein